MSSVKLKLLVLRTPDLDRLRGFYETLGLSFIPEQHGSGPNHLSTQMGETVLELYPLSEKGTAEAGARLGFGVENLEAVLAKLVTQNVKIVTPAKQTPWGLRAVVRDPDGRAVELYQ